MNHKTVTKYNLQTPRKQREKWKERGVVKKKVFTAGNTLKQNKILL